MQIAPQSVTGTAGTTSGIGPIGWFVAAGAVALLYQWKPIRPYVAGVIVLLILGIVLKNYLPVEQSFQKLFSA